MLGMAVAMADPIIVYSAPHSLFSGKLRSYLRKTGQAFVERLPSHPDFGARIAPKIGRVVIPVVETPGGDILQDTTEIIDWFEARDGKIGAVPTTPLMRVLSHILEMWGDEGLLRPAMYYRWKFDAINQPFLTLAFGRMILPQGAPAECASIAPAVMGRMQAYLPALGISDATAAAIEADWRAVLAALDAHFLRHPHVLGGRPSIADFGLMGPAYAHLGRDPVPLALMKAEGERVCRWIERMNVADADMPEFDSYPRDFFADDALPDTLSAILKLVAAQYLPELRALTAFIANHLARHPEITEGAPVIAPGAGRSLGSFQVQAGETAFSMSARHYQIWMLQRVQDAFDAAPVADQPRIRDALAAVGLADLLTLRLPRRIERRHYTEVWGAERAIAATPTNA